MDMNTTVPHELCLLQHPLTHQAMPSDNQKIGLKHPGLMLKYSTFKNLASLAVLRDDLQTAMEFYLEVRSYITSCGAQMKPKRFQI